MKKVEYAYGGDICATVTCKWAKGVGGPAGNECGNMVVVYEAHAQDARYEEKSICPTVTRYFGTGGGNVPLTIEEIEPISIKATAIGRQPQNGGNSFGILPGGPAPTLTTVDRHGVMDTELRVRRLTVTECERLQGFPDGYTRIAWRGKPEEECPDGPRYKAIGNSWAVPVIRWIGKRIMEEMKNGKE